MPVYMGTFGKRIAPEHVERAITSLGLVAETADSLSNVDDHWASKLRDMAIGSIGVFAAADFGDTLAAHAWGADGSKRRFFTRKKAYMRGVDTAFALVQEILATRVCGCPQCAANIAAAEFELHEHMGKER